jgi:cold shock protein
MGRQQCFRPRAPSARIGTVSHWVEERGMGFLTPAEGGPDLFVHRRNLFDGGSLRVGSQVAFQQSWDMQKNKASHGNRGEGKSNNDTS